MTTLTIDIIEKLKCHLRAERFFLNIFPDLFYVFSDIKCNVLAKEREFSTYKKYQTLFVSLLTFLPLSLPKLILTLKGYFCR
jgi:hypothetical protein